MRLIFLFAFICFSPSLLAQTLLFPKDFISAFDTISHTDQLPKGLLQGKSAVIHLTDKKDWKNTADKVQKGLKKAGIDAVAHFHINDIYSGVESYQAYLQQIIDREIKYLIYYREDPEPGLIIFPFKDSFIADNAYKQTNPKLSDLLLELYRKTARSDEQITNLLIVDVPLYMDYPKVINGRRAEFYDLNMKSGKLAIPKLKDSLLNRQIDSVMAAYYPYKYGLVEPGLSNEELRKDGYWFVLYGIQGSGMLVRNLLEYKTTPKETAYASVIARDGETEVRTYPVDQHVVKFYINDTQNKDVFIGKEYDADTTWQTALINYIAHLKSILYR